MKKKTLVHRKLKKVNKTASKAAVTNPIKALMTMPTSTKVVTPVSNQVKIVVPPPVIKKHILYVEVSPDKYFVLCDGRKVKSGKELADILQLINDDMFKYHVTDVKNDFSNWINDVFGEPELAKKMRSLKNRFEMSIELYRSMFEKLEKLSRQK